MTATATLDAPTPEALVSSQDASESPAQTGGFVHLHVHTEFSKQDGLARVKDAANAAAADGQPALAMTDHGNQGGAYKFVDACKKAGIKPILGVEAYMALPPETDWEPVNDADAAAKAAGVPLAMRPGSRFQKTVRKGMDAESGKEKRITNNHLTLLAENEAGWRNLCAIMNKAEDSVYYKSLIDYALIKDHAEGVIVLTGCLGGPLASHVASARRELREGNQAAHDAEMAAARTNLGYLIDCVGADNVYVEIMEHGLEAEGKEHIKILAGLADEFGLRVVATNDSHYIDACDCDAHDSWLVNGENARGNKVRKDDPDRWRFNGEGYWMRTEAEMRALYPKAATWQKACDETVRLAARVQGFDADHKLAAIPHNGLRLPKFPVPADVVAEWDAGAEASVTDITGKEFPARRVGKRAYRSPSALYLHQLVKQGAEARYGGVTSPEAKALGLGKRLNFEFDVITGMGLEDYFLIVWDVLGWARSDRGMSTPEHPEGVPGQKKPILVGPGRGSAAGSAISYCLKIVMVEPLANGLLFERFLDVARIGMPDIDVDFEAARRDEVYDYLVSRYGAEYIARIGAFQVAKTKRAIKDAARVLECVPLGEKLAKAVPVHQGSPQGFPTIFEEVLDKDTGRPKPNPEAQEFRDMVASDSTAQKVVALARSFENVVAGEGIHAAGVIISDEPLTNLIPMRRQRNKQGAIVGVPIALWDGKDIDDFGMLKLDALSLRNLDIVAAAVAHIDHTTGEVIDPDALPDPNTDGDERVDNSFALLREGRTSGIFQLESSGITELCEQIAPTAFEDLSALVALYRPGPMGAQMHTRYAERKNGREDVDYGIYTRDRDEVEVIMSVLDDTFGVIAYQEQMMVLAEVVAGFSADEKNKLRKAFSKKDRPAMEALKDIFVTQGMQEMTLVDGTAKRAFAQKTLLELWKTFDASAEYLFNKSHSAAYGYLAYVTAYFKSNWPTEYGAGILGVTTAADKRLPALFALAQEGIEVLGPDVNLSRAKTAPDPHNPKAVRLGLTEIRDVGNNGKWIAHERETHGDFKDMRDLMTRVKVPGPTGALTAKLSVTAVEGLIEAGAFDSLGLPRLGLMLALRATSAEFAVDVPQAEWSALEQSTRQRLRLGVALGNHPMSAYRDTLREYVFNEREDRWGNPIGGRPAPLHRVAELPRGNMITVGVLTSWAERTTKNGSKMANFTIEGTKASMPGTVFNDAIRDMRKSGTTPQVGDIIGLAGQVKSRTVTNIEIDDESGEEVEVSREVRELIGSFLEVVPVDTAADVDLPEVHTDDRVDLVSAISRAQVRAAEMVEEKKAAAAEARAAKKAATPARAKAKPAAPVLVDPETEDFSDDLLAAPVQAALFDVDTEAVAEASPARADVDASRPWDAAMLSGFGMGPLTDDEVVRDGKPLDRAGREEVWGTFLRGNRKKHLPTEVGTKPDMVYRVEGGCWGKCCSACVNDDMPCEHHMDGGAPCRCSKTCKVDAKTKGTFLLVVVTKHPKRFDRSLLDGIVMESDAWADCGGDSPGWACAPLSAFAPVAV